MKQGTHHAELSSDAVYYAVNVVLFYRPLSMDTFLKKDQLHNIVLASTTLLVFNKYVKLIFS